MSVRNVLLAFAVTAAGFIVGTVFVTELVASAIEFSLLIGLPAGLGIGIGLGLLTYLWLTADDAGPRRRGAALAAFGVLFLTTLLTLIVVANFRNSQALPVAVIVGIGGSVVVSLWFRRADRAVPKPSST